MVEQLFAGEPVTSDEFELLRKIIYDQVIRKVDQNLVGKELVPVKDIDALDVIVSFPDVPELVAEKVAELGSASYQHIQWKHIKGSLDKYQIRVLISDEAKKRQLTQLYTSINIDAAARGMQRAEDKEIMTTLYNAAATSVAANAAWDSTTAQIGLDIANAIEQIFANTLEDTYNNIAVVMPPKAYPHLIRNVIEGTDTTLMDFLEEKFKIKLLKSRYLSTDALVVVNSPETAIHYRAADSAAEVARVPGIGDEYIINAYFKTFIIPDESDNFAGGTNYRIVKITGVLQ